PGSNGGWPCCAARATCESCQARGCDRSPGREHCLARGIECRRERTLPGTLHAGPDARGLQPALCRTTKGDRECAVSVFLTAFRRSVRTKSTRSWTACGRAG